MKIYIAYEGTILSTQFPVKERTKFEHRHNTVYFSRCPNVTCNETYVGKTDRKINKHITDNNKRDRSMHQLKHAHESKTTMYGKIILKSSTVIIKVVYRERSMKRCISRH